MMKMESKELNQESIESVENVLYKALKYSLTVLGLPIFSFFTLLYVFENLLRLSQSDSYFYSAITAVIIIHVILVMLIIEAAKADKKEEKSD